jgi:hypothetical protein
VILLGTSTGHASKTTQLQLDTSVKASSGAMARVGEVCSICQTILCPEPDLCFEPDPESAYFTPVGQTLDTFREASKQSCVICSTVWNLTEQHRRAWSNVSQESWEPFQYHVEKHQGEESIIRLKVLYKDPIKNDTKDLRFRLVPIDSTYTPFALQQYLDTS